MQLGCTGIQTAITPIMMPHPSRLYSAAKALTSQVEARGATHTILSEPCAHYVMMITSQPCFACSHLLHPKKSHSRFRCGQVKSTGCCSWTWHQLRLLVACSISMARPPQPYVTAGCCSHGQSVESRAAAQS